MAFYSDEVIEEVKAVSDIVDVVSNYVTLKRKGNTFFGPCPFHKEKTPSFAVTPDKQIYHCFGCGEGGNVIKFIMKVENINFKEAIDFLADRAKIDLPATNYEDMGISNEELKIREYHKNQMYEINKEAGRFFYSNIEKSSEAKSYIAQRKLEPKTVAKFGLGFALNDNGLYKYLLEKGFKEEDMLATGLVGKTEKGYLYDKFKNRFMFPIFDIRGRVIAFGGRTLESKEVMKAEHIPKYVNSPENLIYSKGKHLYGLNFAKALNSKMKKILVVEGYMDVISPHQTGVTNVVASLGTALTESQGRLLRQYGEEIILSYDSDEAGQKAIMRGLEVMQNLGVTSKVLKMDGAKDPDEFVLKYGAEKFRKLIDDSISFVEFKVSSLKMDYNLNDTTDKIRFLNKLALILSKIDNNIERDVYVDKFSRDLNVGKEAIYAEIEKLTFKIANNAPKFEGPKISNNIDKQEVENAVNDIESMLIYLLCEKDLKVYERLRKFVSIDDVQIEVNKSIVKKLYDIYENGKINTVDINQLCENEEEFSAITAIMMRDNVVGDREKIADEVIKNITNNKLQKRKKEVVDMLSNVKTDEERKKLEIELNELITKTARK